MKKVTSILIVSGWLGKIPQGLGKEIEEIENQRKNRNHLNKLLKISQNTKNNI